MAPVDTLSFKCALITGGGGGLGRAMSESLLARGKKVIIVGRTESKLQSAAKEMGATGYYVLDTGDVSSIPGFIRKVTTEHPELDCVINNAGVQRPFQVLGPDYGFDLAKADQEVDINIRGPMHLTVGFVQHFNEKKIGGVVMNVSSILGFNPSSLINPVYNGTKAWVHYFTTNIRTQLAQAGSNVRIVEIVPPAVETDLHRERKDPDDNKRDKGNKVALTVPEFIKEVEQGWEKNQDTITAGPGHDVVDAWNSSMGEKYLKATGGK